MMRITVGLLIVTSVLVQGADAGPVLLASYEAHAAAGFAPESDPHVEFFLQLPSPPDVPGPVDFQGVGQGVFWANGASGSVEFRPDNDQYFTQFAAAATDGANDEFVLWGLFPSGAGGGGDQGWSRTCSAFRSILRGTNSISFV